MIHPIKNNLYLVISWLYTGEATELEITAKLMVHTKETLNTYLAHFCDQPIDKLRSDTDRDFYMTPNEALSYGIIDEVIQHKYMIPDPKIPMLKTPPPLRAIGLEFATLALREKLAKVRRWSVHLDFPIYHAGPF